MKEQKKKSQRCGRATIIRVLLLVGIKGNGGEKEKGKLNQKKRKGGLA